MAVRYNKTFLRCLSQMLRPMAALCLNMGVTIQQFVECTKLAFVHTAKDEIEKAGEVPNVSRLSLLTGLRRREVGRLLEIPSEDQVEHKGATLARVVGRWLSDREFKDASGKPKTLSATGEKSDFYKLVRKISRDISPGTVLGELLRSATVEMVADGISLREEMYVSVPDSDEGLEFLGLDVRDLLIAAQENILNKAAIKNHHLTTEFTAIPESKISEVREWLIDHGAKSHKVARDYLAALDQDLSGTEKKDRTNLFRVSFGSFGLVEKTKPKKEQI